MPRLSFYLLLVIFIWQPVLPANAAPSTEELEKWFESDEPAPPSTSSDSQLRFIPPPNKKPPLHSINTITIKPQSLKDGWVDLQQCYRHLDAVPDMEVTYQYRAMRKLEIKRTQNIGKAYVENNSVQLSNVGKNAQLCVSAQVRIFYQTPDGSYQLVNGPFHRQFLDSFFPYHLTMNVHYPASLIKFVNSKPQQQAGFIINLNRGSLGIDCFFTGKLFTELTFTPISP